MVQDDEITDAEIVDEVPVQRGAELEPVAPVLDAEVVERPVPPHRQPYPHGALYSRGGLGQVTGGVALRGGVVTDSDEIAAIRARMAFYSRPWWRRWGTRP